MKKSILMGFTMAVVVLLGTVAMAASKKPSQPATPSSDVLTACVKKVNGQVRIISSGGKCLPSETAISWNVAGPQGPAGPAGPEGPAGQAGPQGPSGVVTTEMVSGAVGTVAGNSTSWVFAGPTVSTSTTATESITGAVQSPLGTTETGIAAFKYDLCYRAAGTSDVLINFAGSGSSSGEVTSATTASLAAIGSVVPGSGTWEVGYCLLNSGAVNLDRNGNANGWIMVTE